MKQWNKSLISFVSKLKYKLRKKWPSFFCWTSKLTIHIVVLIRTTQNKCRIWSTLWENCVSCEQACNMNAWGIGIPLSLATEIYILHQNPSTWDTLAAIQFYGIFGSTCPSDVSVYDIFNSYCWLLLISLWAWSVRHGIELQIWLAV